MSEDWRKLRLKCDAVEDPYEPLGQHGDQASHS